jgi:hypothetical protein
MFCPIVGKSKIVCRKVRNVCFSGLEKPGIFGIPNIILQDTGTDPKSPIKRGRVGVYQTLSSHTQLFKEALTVTGHRNRFWSINRRYTGKEEDFRKDITIISGRNILCKREENCGVAEYCVLVGHDAASLGSYPSVSRELLSISTEVIPGRQTQYVASRRQDHITP